MGKNGVLIFSGYNNRAVITFCRFSVQKKIPFYIVSKGEEDLIYKSDYVKNIVYKRKKTDLSIEDVLFCSNLIRNKKDLDKIVILPSTEYLNRLLLENYILLLENNIEFGLHKRDVYELLSNKHSFGELCRVNSINIPSQILKDDATNFPLVVKPKTYFNKQNEVFAPEVVHNKEELDSYFKNKNEENFYLQEYIKGRSIYFLYYIFPNGSYSVYSQENYMQQFNGGSMIIAKSSECHSNKIAAEFADIFVNVGYKGLIMVEVKVFNEKFYMIEANPRLWGPSQLILDAQMDLFDCFAYDNGLITELTNQKYLPDTWYYWSGGLTENLNNELPVTFYNFDEDNLEINRNEIEQNEVYNRKDTVSIYKFENK